MILQLAGRTITKILSRLSIGCSNCGWDKSTCDIHHILPRSKGGTDEHSNLCVLCPNCHRLAHTGKLLDFKSFEEQVGDKWKDVYDPKPAEIARSVGIKRKEIAKFNSARRLMADQSVPEKMKLISQSEIDFSKYGWVSKVAPLLDVTPQKVKWWFKRYNPTFLEKCFSRK